MKWLYVFSVVSILLGTANSRPHTRVARPSSYAEAFARHREVRERELTDVHPLAPQQVLTALAGDFGAITLSWVTFQESATEVFWWDPKDNSTVSLTKGTSFKWADPQNKRKVRYQHTVELQGLKPKQSIQYRVGEVSTPRSLSGTYSFKMPPNGDEVLTMAIFGDMGVVNSQAIKYVIEEVEAGEVDVVLHMGDYAYDLHTHAGNYGDIFMNDIEPIASRVPYMGTVGNHDTKYNASHYTHRFAAYLPAARNSGSDTNWWYSWDYVSGGATVHMVSIDTEMYFDYVDEFPAPDQTIPRRRHYEWLDKDLARARNTADWLIVFGHRPMYCSNDDSDHDCFSDTNTLRNGWNGTYPLEELLYRHGVDLYLSGHEHSYERVFPTYKSRIDPTVVVTDMNHTYTGARFPTHLVSGSAGCDEYFDTFSNATYGLWSVFRSSTYGYGHLRVHNATHLHWDQLLDEGRAGRDWLWLVK